MILTFDLRENISTLQKKVDAVNIEFDNINKYEHGHGLLLRTVHRRKIVKILFSIYSGIIET